MSANYQITDRKDSRALARFLSGEGQALLPMLELIEQAEMAVDELIDVAGRATIEAVLTLSARELAGPKHPGKKAGGAIGWHGEQNGVVSLAVAYETTSRHQTFNWPWGILMPQTQHHIIPLSLKKLPGTRILLTVAPVPQYATYWLRGAHPQ